MKKCQEWLEKKHPALFARIWSPGASSFSHNHQTHDTYLNPLLPPTEALTAATASLSVEAQERAAKDAKKKAAKAEAAEQKQADKLASSVVTIKRIERNKRKYVTAVIGLEAFGLDLKKVGPLSLLFFSVFPFCFCLYLGMEEGLEH